MAIQSIEIKNFTVFKNIKCDFSPGVNVFIGENGTGKTHLLKLSYLANTLHSSNYLYRITDLFGNDFGEKNCYLCINGNEQRLNMTIEKGQISQIKSLISLEISSKIPSVFIPAKEVLSMSNITRVADEYTLSLNLDITLTDIIKKAQILLPDTPPDLALKVASKLEHEMQGKVFFDDTSKTFWIHKTNGDKIPFTSEAEGFRKLGLLWQLVMNKSIKEGSVLFWDEPEANLNPKLIPIIVDILLELARHGVQIFIATHDYVIAKYLEVRRNSNDVVLFHSLYNSDDGVKSESSINFRDLKENPIITALDTLMDEIIDRNMGD